MLSSPYIYHLKDSECLTGPLLIEVLADDILKHGEPLVDILEVPLEALKLRKDIFKLQHEKFCFEK